MPDDPIPSFSAMLRNALADALAPDATTFLDMLAEDGVMEFPFAPPGMTTRLEGRAALGAHLKMLGGIVAFEAMGAPVVHRASDVFVLEFEGRGRGLKTGKPYAQSYVSVIRVEGGRITQYRDYWNPLVVLDTMGVVIPTAGAEDAR